MLAVHIAVESTQLENTPGMDPEYFWQLKTDFLFLQKRKKSSIMALITWQMWLSRCGHP